jgi:hypothetical protein
MEPYIDQDDFVRDHCCVPEGQIMYAVARLVEDMTHWLVEMPWWKKALYWVTHLWPVRRIFRKRWTRSFERWRHRKRLQERNR